MQVHREPRLTYHDFDAPETCVSNTSSSAPLLQVIVWTTRPILSQTFLRATAEQTLRDVHSHRAIVFNADAHRSASCHQRLHVLTSLASLFIRCHRYCAPAESWLISLAVALTSRDGCTFTIDCQPDRTTRPYAKNTTSRLCSSFRCGVTIVARNTFSPSLSVQFPAQLPTLHLSESRHDFGGFKVLESSNCFARSFELILPVSLFCRGCTLTRVNLVKFKCVVELPSEARCMFH